MKLNIGTMAHFAGDFVPQDWLLCDGRKILQGGEYDALWDILQDRPAIKRDQNYFWLPNFPVGESEVPKQIVLNRGVFKKDSDESAESDEDSDFYGLITTIEANEAVPDKWALCDGRLLTIESKNNALFSILRTEYGGDGKKTFALPKMADLGTKRYIICVDGRFPSRTY